MQLKSWKIYVVLTFLTNIVLALIMISYMDSPCVSSTYERKFASYIHSKSEEHKIEALNLSSSIEHLTETTAVVIREFEFFENDVENTIKSITDILPSINIYIVCDSIPYPPLNINKFNTNVKVISLKPSINEPFGLHQPLNIINEDHIFIFPDSVRLHNLTQISKMLEYHYLNPQNIIAAPIEDEESVCLYLNISLRYWTIKYQKKDKTYLCNAMQGMHIILVAKNVLLQFGFPFGRPFSTAFYIQATLKKIKVNTFLDKSFTSLQT